MRSELPKPTNSWPHPQETSLPYSCCYESICYLAMLLLAFLMNFIK